MSVTDLRDQQNDEWHAWADRDPDRAREHNRRRRDELAKETSGKKARLCEFVSDEGEPCIRPHHGKGWCAAHYRQAERGVTMRALWRRQECAFVSVDGEPCGNSKRARGYCIAHYWQWRRGGAMRPVATSAAAQPPAHLDVPGARVGEPWAEWEFDLAMSDTPLREVALRLGRTYSSVVRARQRRRKMLGLDITYLKTDSDPYDGSGRAGVLYVKEAE